jgi:hypothetical protein
MCTNTLMRWKGTTEPFPIHQANAMDERKTGR